MKDEIFSLIEAEGKRQTEELQMIPSENFASFEVRRALGSVMVNKYSEGQVGKRYYQGNRYIDEVEKIAKDRALKVFGLDAREWGVNVQALSGSPANLAVFSALLEPGKSIFSMHLGSGGHLSHGWHFKDRPVSFVSKIWKVDFYTVDRKTSLLDYRSMRERARELKPQIIVSGGTAYSREIDHEKIGKVAKDVGAYYLADIAHEAGLVAAGVNESPFVFADVVTMTTHKTLRGPRGAMIFGRRRKEIGGKTVEISDLVDRAVFPGLQGGPHNHTIAGIGVCLAEAEKPAFKKYSRQVIANAQTLAREFEKAGLKVVSGGTDKHLLLLDLREKGVSGWVAALALEAAGIIVNRNSIPFDEASPFFPSGIRLGTPALTTRGMKEKEMKKIAFWMVDVIDYSVKWRLPGGKKERSEFIPKFNEELSSDSYLKSLKERVRDLCLKFPIPE